jgi:sialic acid synthase SpsE
VITIGTHTVGPGHKPFIIAEVGSNWASFEDCKNSIAQAKQCGADAVKFQAYDAQSLYGLDWEWEGKVITKDSLWGRMSAVRSGLMDSTLLLEWLPKLAEKAKACGIEFMCSAFSPELAEAVNPFVNVHKVASAELTHVRLLQKLRSFGKPVILSTGASWAADIKQALKVLEGVPVILMYCVAAYPAQEINLDTIPLMLSTFGVPIGFSDHSVDVGFIPAGAVRAGAVVIEKHFTALPVLACPDRGHSLTPDQFKRMVGSIRGGGTVSLGPSREEKPMILRHNRRLIATRDIAVGEALTEGVNFGAYRSLKDDTKAASPWMIDQMNGKAVKRAIPAGDGISYADV